MAAPSGRSRAASFLLAINRAAVPVLRSPVAPLFFNPVTGWACVVWTAGRRSGLRRPVPLNYAIVDGGVCCIAGFGFRAHWYRNILADPRVGIDLPLRRLAAVAREVTDQAERLPRLRAILRAAGWAGWLFAPFPDRLSDEDLLARSADLPVIEFRARGTQAEGIPIAPSAFDPGGRGWIPIAAGQVVVGAVVVGIAARFRRRRRSDESGVVARRTRAT